MSPASAAEAAPKETRGVSIAEAARQLGVPMPTLRSWERRYHLMDTDRGAGQHRRYSPAELHGLRLMRDQIARGKRASVAAASVRDLLDRTGLATDFIGDILDASEQSDPALVRDHLARAHAALGLGACLDDVLLPALQQVGLWWQTGRCDVAQEFLTTEAARAWLESLTAYAPPPSQSTTIVLACGPTDLHTVGLESLAVLLRYEKWACRLLGARTSIAALTATVQATGAEAVVLVSHLSTGRRRAILALHAATDLDVRVFYAGNSFAAPRSRRSLPGTYLGPTLRGARELIVTELSGGSGAPTGDSEVTG